VDDNELQYKGIAGTGCVTCRCFAANRWCVLPLRKYFLSWKGCYAFHYPDSCCLSHWVGGVLPSCLNCLLLTEQHAHRLQHSKEFPHHHDHHVHPGQWNCDDHRMSHHLLQTSGYKVAFTQAPLVNIMPDKCRPFSKFLEQLGVNSSAKDSFDWFACIHEISSITIHPCCDRHRWSHPAS
jgi:hypothetical protein